MPGRRRSIVWACFDEPPATERRRRVICRFCGRDVVANPLRMARHVEISCPRADDAHRRLCSEYRSPDGRGVRAGAASAAASGARGSLSPAASAAAAAGAAEPEEMETEEPPDDDGTKPAQLPAADASRDGQQRRLQKDEAPEGERFEQREALRRSLELSASVRAAKSSDDGSVHDGGDHDNRPEESAATPSNASVPAAIEELSVAEMESVWTDLVLALVTQSAVGDAPQWSLLESEHFQRALAQLRPEFQLPSVRDARELVVPKLLGAVQSDTRRFFEGAGAAAALTVLCSADVVRGCTLVFRWFGVDQDARSQVLAVTSQDAAARPEEIALHLRGSFDAIRREVLEHHPVQRQKLPFLVHLCTGSLGPARCAHRQLLAKAVSSVDHPDGAAAAAPALVGGCMMQQSLLLFHDALETLSSVRAALETCAEVALFVASCEPLRRDLRRRHVTLDLTPQPPSAESFHSFLVCVNQVLALKGPLSAVIGDDSSSSRVSGGGVPAYLASSTRALRFMEIMGDESFWARLAFVKETLAPFACLLALSNAGHATSGQLLACWLLLRTTVANSSLVSETEKAAFSTRFVDRVRESGDAHAFASLIVDPRVQGLGLSAFGKRKARLILVDLAARLQPGVKRSRLIEQLLTFLNRSRPFDDDEDSWNMMASLPRLFWLEYVEEMPELASVALAVLSYRPHLAPLDETWRELARRCQRPALDPESCSTVSGGDSLQAVLELEHVKLHFQNMSSTNNSSDRRPSTPADTALDESLRKYRKCLVRESGDDALAALFDAKSEELEERSSSSGGAEVPRDASSELQQLRLWLQRVVGEQETSGAAADDADNAQREADESLPGFHAEWLDTSADCAQRVRACVDKFTVDSESSR